MQVTNPNHKPVLCATCGEITQSVYGYHKGCRPTGSRERATHGHTEMDDRTYLPEDYYFRGPSNREDDYSEESKP